MKFWTQLAKAISITMISSGVVLISQNNLFMGIITLVVGIVGYSTLK